MNPAFLNLLRDKQYNLDYAGGSSLNQTFFFFADDNDIYLEYPREKYT